MHNISASFSVVIPAYYERDNIREVLERVHRSVEPLGYPYEVIIVGDKSPEQTWQVAADYRESYRVRVLRRNGKRGLATAVVEGIKASNYEIIVIMGAGLQHPPETIPRLIAEIRDGKDVVVGSRFVESGASEQSRLFRPTARDTDLLARTLFRQIRGIKDLQSGFFAIRKDVVAHANLNPVGNRILLEILVQGAYTTVSEIPDWFEKREAGTNRPGVKNSLDYIRHLCGLFRRSGELHRFLKFCAVGGAGAVLNLVVLYVLTELGVFYLLSGFVAIEAGLLSNFVLNRSWTFNDRGVKGLRFVLTALYRDHAVRFVGIIINLVILWLLTSVFGLYYLLSQLIGIGVAMLWNYGGNQWWTWEPV
jgi:dolichol-phosphate mannosyltransferase